MSRVRLYRRSPTLALFPRDGRMVAADYALGVEAPVSPAELALLGVLDAWTSAPDAAARAADLRARAVAPALRRLHRLRLIEASDEPASRRREAVKEWRGWLPEAGLFHFSRRDLPRMGLSDATTALATKAALFPPPPPVKPPAPRALPLPPYDRRSAVPRLLLQRRSWRRFGQGSLTHLELSTLLGLTWGVQRWMHVANDMRVALKTAPSPGATHALEVYVLAARVRGLRRGIYRYCPDRHELVMVRERLAPDAAHRLLRQPWFADCAAAFFMTAVWPRVQFKYELPRTYASVFIEAGHFAQNFCLLATWLGLAPFCTANFGASAVDRMLRLDGVRESALYATGVGRRPSGVAWAPWPDMADTPPTSQPASRSRGAGSTRRRHDGKDRR